MSEPLGLFPLPLVLVPTERIPLHIFEDRYRELIGECLEEGTEFGFVLATGDGAVHEIGTRAWVAEVLDEPAAPADIEQALALFGTLVEISDADVDPPGPETPQLDFELAARVDFGVDAKQELLATTSPRRRMERLVALLDQAIELLRIEQTMRERASRNGKITHADHGSGPGSGAHD